MLSVHWSTILQFSSTWFRRRSAGEDCSKRGHVEKDRLGIIIAGQHDYKSVSMGALTWRKPEYLMI